MFRWSTVHVQARRVKKQLEMMSAVPLLLGLDSIPRDSSPATRQSLILFPMRIGP